MGLFSVESSNILFQRPIIRTRRVGIIYFWKKYLLINIFNESNSMIYIKRPNFFPKSLSNTLVYLKIGKSQCMKYKTFLKKSLLIKQSAKNNSIPNLRSFKQQGDHNRDHRVYFIKSEPTNVYSKFRRPCAKFNQ